MESGLRHECTPFHGSFAIEAPFVRELLRETHMDEKNFKKHLKDLIRGFHHPEEHDWGTKSSPRQTAGASKRAARRTKRRPAR